MLVALKRQWHGLQRGVPGERFQNRYANARRNRAHTPVWSRALRIGLALILAVTGLVFAFIPGPAILFFAMAGALLASESRTVARSLDWIELRLRVGWHWSNRHWKRLGLAGRVFLIAVAIAVGAAAALLAWHVFMG